MSNPSSISSMTGGARPKIRNFSKGLQQVDPVVNPHVYGQTTDDHSSLKNDIYASQKQTSVQNMKEFSFSNADSLDSSSSISANCSLLPLDKKEITVIEGGVQMKRMALSREWVEEKIFVQYTRPPLPTEADFVDGATEAWVERMKFLWEDLSWLLSLPHHRFWSHMMFDKSVHECLDSYLTNGPRWYEEVAMDEESLSLANDVHRLVFLIHLRLATYKESKNEFITTSVFGDLIYDNFLYDISKMLDLCSLYGTTNRPLLQKMIDNVFTHQPKYYNDLGEFIGSLKNIFTLLEEKLGVFDSSIPQFATSDVDTSHSPEELNDLVFYVLDTLSSVQLFLSTFPKGCAAFRQKEFDIRLSVGYERIIPNLVERLSTSAEVDWTGENLELKGELLKAVDMVRMSALTLFRTIFNAVCFQQDHGDSNSDMSNKIECFTHILTSCIEEKTFIYDFNSTFDLDKDIAFFKERGVDMTAVNFVKEAVDVIVQEVKSQQEASKEETNLITHNVHLQQVDDTSGMNGYYSGETSSLSQVEIESLISSVQDLLPDLGSGFVSQCLKYYSYSTEEVLNALLENNLPPSLESLDRSMQLSSAENSLPAAPPTIISEEIPQEPLKEEVPASFRDVLSDRKNIYDNDKFDMFNQPEKFNNNKVHKGKKVANPTLEMADEHLRQKMKNIFDQYTGSAGFSIYDDELKYTPILESSSAQYEDEYDDTYDDYQAVDDDSYDKRKVPTFSTIRGKGALNQRGMNFVDDESDDDDEQNQDEKMTNGGLSVNGRESRHQMVGGENLQSSTVFSNSGRNMRKDRYRNTNNQPSNQRDSDYPDSRPDNQNLQPDDGGIHKLSFKPFCENPEVVRERMQRRRADLQFRNKGYSQPSSGAQTSAPTQSYTQTSTKSNKHSGKSWRQGAQDDTGGERRPHGGKYKEDTNHGKAQDRDYKHKMVHKNEHKRNAAQYKYRNNF